MQFIKFNTSWININFRLISFAKYTQKARTYCKFTNDVTRISVVSIGTIFKGLSTTLELPIKEEIFLLVIVVQK